MDLEMSQVIAIEDITDPKINPAAKWLSGNHTRVTWVEPNASGELWPVHVWDACSHDNSVGPVMVIFEGDLSWLRSEEGNIAEFIENLAKEKH